MLNDTHNTQVVTRIPVIAAAAIFRKRYRDAVGSERSINEDGEDKVPGDGSHPNDVVGTADLVTGIGSRVPQVAQKMA